MKGAATGAFRVAAACLALAACAEAPPPPAGPDRAAQEAACAAAVAAHVGLPAEAVATVWRETGPDGVAVFEARDGNRLHLCEVSVAGRVSRIEHPRGVSVPASAGPSCFPARWAQVARPTGYISDA